MHVVDLVPVERRGWALGIYGVSGFLGTALAPVAGELIVRRLGFELALPARPCSWAVAAAWLVVRIARDPPAEHGRGAGARARCVRGSPKSCGCTWRWPSSSGSGTGAMFTFLPTFGEWLGVHSVSLFYTAYAIAAVGVRVGGGNLIDTRGRRAVIIPSMFVHGGLRGTPDRPGVPRAART